MKIKKNIIKIHIINVIIVVMWITDVFVDDKGVSRVYIIALIYGNFPLNI